MTSRESSGRITRSEAMPIAGSARQHIFVTKITMQKIKTVGFADDFKRWRPHETQIKDTSQAALIGGHHDRMVTRSRNRRVGFSASG